MIFEYKAKSNKKLNIPYYEVNIHKPIQHKHTTR